VDKGQDHSAVAVDPLLSSHERAVPSARWVACNKKATLGLTN